MIMPAYNESGNIQRVVTDVSGAIPNASIIVINDGSTDATGALARQAGAIVIDLPFNLGIGGAVQTGYKFAVTHGYRYVARLDGDGQHDPTHLMRLMEPLVSGQADIVIGSRFAGDAGVAGDESYRATTWRTIGIRLFAYLVSLIVRQRVTDTTSGYQVCNADAAAFFARNFPRDYPEVEMITAACRAGYRIKEVPVTMRWRKAGRSSITATRSIYYVVKVLFALLVNVLRPPDEHLTVSATRPADEPLTATFGLLDGHLQPPRADQGIA
jgi:glycosyltransferase involved in cell wall biosynthesis